ncbi:MAG: alpha/beta hydrolase [Sandarakinorhabdus sp.]|nr:alpha/beta hydrolase [Sandarakinorhabdus sp.]
MMSLGRRLPDWRVALVSGVFAISPAALAAKSFYVPGAGGVPLAVTEVGPKGAPEILFLHGLGQGRESFRPQLDSALASKYHMVAFDLRGHGMSGKPWDEAAYAETATWAEDVGRVMAATGMKRPVVVAWSYGTLVAADFIRANGAAGLSGLMLVSSVGGLVKAPPPTGPVPPDLVKSRQLRASVDLADQQEAQRLLAPYLTGGSIPPDWRAMAITQGTMVPPFVDAALRKHKGANADLVPALNLPVLVVSGKLDAAIDAATVNALVAQVPGARASRFDRAGHSPFAEDPARFNAELAAFVDRVWHGAAK